MLHAELDASAQHVFAVAADRAESRAYAGTADLAVALIDEAATVLDELRVDRLAVRQALLERSSAG